MCFGVPGLVTQITDVTGLPTGKAEFGGVPRDVCFAYVPEARVGDYVLVHAGFAVRIVAEGEARARYRTSEARYQRVIQPVSTSVPSAAWQCRRNGLAGMGWMAKQPSSSTWVVAIAPDRVWISIVP